MGRADMIDMEAVQFHPTGMVWPLSVRGILVTEGVRGDGGVLRNQRGEPVHVRLHPPHVRGRRPPTPRKRGPVVRGPHQQPPAAPSCCPRDEVARSINSEVKAGRGTPHGGVYLDIATRRSADEIRRRLPSMYHQFKELAGVDITAQSMEVGPTCHYMMGGVRVDAETEQTTVPGLFAAGEVAGGCTGPTGSGELAVGPPRVRAPGRHAAAAFAQSRTRSSAADAAEVAAVVAEAEAPLGRDEGESAYDIHHALQQMMQELVGIIRTESELRKALDELDTLSERVQRMSVKGGRAYNPGWNLATDLPPCSPRRGW